MVVYFGKFLGYNAKASKSWLIVKPEYLEYGQIVGIVGRRHLGAVVGSKEFKEKYVETLVNSWVEEIKVLSRIARIEPHVAYTAFTNGLQHRYTFYMRTISGIENQLKPLDEALNNHLIKSLLDNYQVRSPWDTITIRHF